MQGWGAIVLVAVVLSAGSLGTVVDDAVAPAVAIDADAAAGRDRSGAQPSSSQASTSALAAVADPEGDAREGRPQGARNTATNACTSTTGRGCPMPVPDGPTGTALDGVGTAARPMLDLSGLVVEETPSDVVVTFEVAALPEDPEAHVADNEILRYSAQFGDDPDRRPSGSVHVLLQNMKYHHAARIDVFYNGGPFGADWSAPYEIVPGTPGVIRVTVPRAYFPYHATGEAFGVDAWAETYRYQIHANGTRPYVDVWTRDVEKDTDPSAMTHEWVDVTERVALAPFATSHAPRPVSADPVVLDDAGETGDPRFDITSSKILENATHVGLEIELAKVEEDPSPYLFVLLSLPDPPAGTWPGYYSGTEVWAGSNVFDGERRTYSSRADATEAGSQTRPIEVAFEHEPGEPGKVRFTWLRADLGDPPLGAMVAQIEAMLWEPDAVVYRDVEQAGAGAEAGFGGTLDPSGSKFDYVEHRRPYFLATGPATDLSPLPLARVEDAEDDVVVPTEVTLVDASFGDSVDVTFVEAKASAPGETRVALGIRDLGDMRVPNGYHAVAFAVAVDTPAGPFMAVHYRSEQVKEFFCAPDVTVFPPDAEKRDPYDSIFTPIQGTVAGAPARAGGGEGAIVFRVPNTCFGDEQAETLAGSRLAAGTYLVRRTPAGVEVAPLDEVAADTPVVLGAVRAPPPPVPWWDAPLGVREFWNILGVGLAVAGGMVALGARQRRRTVLQRQMKAIEETHARHREDPPAWRKAMSERRAAVADLMRRGRLKGEEVLVAERRIELLAADVVEPPKAAPPAAVGSVLAERYELQRLIGEGGQGRAFLARDRTLDRDVVVKVLSTGGLDGRAKRLLLAEARLSAMVDHPNVVRVLDVRESEADAQAILILEYVEGGTLRALLDRKGRLPTGEALRIFRGVLAGLHAAHERGVVHRDVKPENVLLTSEGVPKLADFGAARDAGRQATVVPQATGTLAYMSPEQVRGLRVDARSDVYSAAAMLHEMLTGRRYLPLDEADEFQARAMILERAPEVRLPDDALALTGVLLRALAKAPQERFATAKDLRVALDEAVGG